jgi:hypothetical protein
MRLRAHALLVDTRNCEGSDRGSDAFAGSALSCTAQQRAVKAGVDVSDRVRLGEVHVAAWVVEMHCC